MFGQKTLGDAMCFILHYNRRHKYLAIILFMIKNGMIYHGVKVMTV